MYVSHDEPVAQFVQGKCATPKTRVYRDFRITSYFQHLSFAVLTGAQGLLNHPVYVCARVY
jgi:hypothetical protein